MTYLGFVRIGIVAGLVLAGWSLPTFADGSPTFNGNGQVQEGEAGDKLGATAADAFGLPGAKERLDAKVHNPGEPYGPPASAASPPEQYGPQPEPEPAPGPVPVAPSGSGDSN